MVRLLIVHCRIEESSWSIEINLNPFYIEMQNFFYSLWLMTASFKGKNPVTWLQAKSPLSFVFSSAFIQQLTKSLLKVCFGFIYLHFNKFRAHLLQGSFCLELYFAPFLVAVYSCDHNAYKNYISSRRAQPVSLVTSQHLGHTLETRTLRTTFFNLLSVFKQLKQVPFFSLV